jgi:predicted enzyme related to lactoylglutathione lyase
MRAPVVHFEVNSKNLARAKEFYGTLFGWKIQDFASMSYGMVDTGVKVGINGGIAQVGPEGQPFVTFYVAVEDPQATLDKAVSLGAKVVVPVTVVPDVVTLALFADPDGCLVGLVQDMKPTPEARPTRKPSAKKKAVKVGKGKGRKKRAKR